LGSLQRSPGSLARFKGPTSKGKEEREGEIRGEEVRLPHSKFLDPPLSDSRGRMSEGRNVQRAYNEER